MTTAQSPGRAVLASALNQTPDQLGENPELGATAAWDSLAHMRLILEMEALIDRKLQPMEIVSISSLHDVENILSDHGASGQ